MTYIDIPFIPYAPIDPHEPLLPGPLPNNPFANPIF